MRTIFLPEPFLDGRSRTGGEGGGWGGAPGRWQASGAPQRVLPSGAGSGCRPPPLPGPRGAASPGPLRGPLHPDRLRRRGPSPGLVWNILGKSSSARARARGAAGPRSGATPGRAPTPPATPRPPPRPPPPRSPGSARNVQKLPKSALVRSAERSWARDAPRGRPGGPGRFPRIHSSREHGFPPPPRLDGASRAPPPRACRGALPLGASPPVCPRPGPRGLSGRVPAARAPPRVPVCALGPPPRPAAPPRGRCAPPSGPASCDAPRISSVARLGDSGRGTPRGAVPAVPAAPPGPPPHGNMAFRRPPALTALRARPAPGPVGVRPSERGRRSACSGGGRPPACSPRAPPARSRAPPPGRGPGRRARPVPRRATPRASARPPCSSRPRPPAPGAFGPPPELPGLGARASGCPSPPGEKGFSRG